MGVDVGRADDVVDGDGDDDNEVQILRYPFNLFHYCGEAHPGEWGLLIMT